MTETEMSSETRRARARIENRRKLIEYYQKRLSPLRTAEQILERWCDTYADSPALPGKTLTKVRAAHSELQLELRSVEQVAAHRIRQEDEEIEQCAAKLGEMQAQLGETRMLYFNRTADAIERKS